MRRTNAPTHQRTNDRVPPVRWPYDGRTIERLQTPFRHPTPTDGGFVLSES